MADTPNAPPTDPSQPPTAPTAPQPTTMGSAFGNTSTVKPTRPNGIPDPKNPGYDTAGYRIGSSVDANGNIIVPNTTTGKVGTTTPSGQTTFAPLPTTPNNPPPSSVLQKQLFGDMPAIPKPPAFDYAAFAPPSWQDVLNNDPGVSFGIDQGEKALQQSAAARGTLNTGGTLKDILDYGRNAATQGYQGAFDRSLGSYVTNFGNALTKYNTNYGTQFLNPYNQAFDQYKQGVNNQGQIFGQQFSTATA